MASSKHEMGDLLPPGAKVETFQVTTLRATNTKSYSEIKRSFQAEKQSVAKFNISEMVANQLSVEDEELRRFEKRVEQELERRLGQLKDEAYKKGFEEGTQAGTQKAYQEEKSKLEQQTTLTDELLTDLQTAIAELSKRYEKELMDTAFRIAEIILNTEIEKDPSILAATVSDILEKISKEDDAIIKLPKEYSEIIPKIKEKIQEKSIRPGRVQFEVDAQIKKGDLVVECLSGEVSSFLNEKIALLKEEIVKRQNTKG
jgi:flagellar assembly protein FliH